MSDLEHSAVANFQVTRMPLRYRRFDPVEKKLVEVQNALDLAKADRVAEVNEWRESYSFGQFEFLEKKISCDRLSRSDIDGINGYVALYGSFPPGWVGQWKCVDNSYIDIPSVDVWKAMYAAMVAQGQAAFIRAQTLKAQIAACEKLDDVLEIEVC